MDTIKKYIDAEKLKAEINKRLFIFEHGIAYSCWADCKRIVESLQQEQPEVDLEKAARHVYEYWNGGTMYDVRRSMVELGKVLNAKKGRIEMYSILEQHKDGAWWYHPGQTFTSRDAAEAEVWERYGSGHGGARPGVRYYKGGKA